MKLFFKLFIFFGIFLIHNTFAEEEAANSDENENEDEDEVELDNTTPKVGENNNAGNNDNTDDENWDEEGIQDPMGSVTPEGQVLSYDEQKSRAKICLFVARINANPNVNEADESGFHQGEVMKQMMDSYVKGSQGQLTKEKAFEMIMVHVFSRCYKNSDQEIIDKISKQQVYLDEPEMQDLIIKNSLKNPLNPHKEQLNKDEWDVVNEVLEEERKKQGPTKQTKEQKRDQQKKNYKQANSDVFGLPGMNMSGGMKFVYMLVMLAVFFSICGFALRKLYEYNEKSKISDKRVNEKKLAKKQAKEAAILDRKKLR